MNREEIEKEAQRRATDFLKGLSGDSGREGESASNTLSDNLRELGLSLGRLKTGTPPRLKKDSIDFSRFRLHQGDDVPVPFSHTTKEIRLPQLPSHIGSTNERVHRIVRDNLDRSALYGGRIQGVSARYCRCRVKAALI